MSTVLTIAVVALCLLLLVSPTGGRLLRAALRDVWRSVVLRRRGQGSEFVAVLALEIRRHLLTLILIAVAVIALAVAFFIVERTAHGGHLL
jgi:hypothetical protein